MRCPQLSHLVFVSLYKFQEVRLAREWSSLPDNGKRNVTDQLVAGCPAVNEDPGSPPHSSRQRVVTCLSFDADRPRGASWAPRHCRKHEKTNRNERKRATDSVSGTLQGLLVFFWGRLEIGVIIRTLFSDRKVLWHSRWWEEKWRREFGESFCKIHLWFCRCRISDIGISFHGPMQKMKTNDYSRKDMREIRKNGDQGVGLKGEAGGSAGRPSGSCGRFDEI